MEMPQFDRYAVGSFDRRHDTGVHQFEQMRTLYARVLDDVDQSHGRVFDDFKRVNRYFIHDAVLMPARGSKLSSCCIRSYNSRARGESAGGVIVKES